MPDFVLDVLNQCLPSREQEESVLNAPSQPSPYTLQVPNMGFIETNHLLTEHNHTGSRSSRSYDEANEVHVAKREEELALERVTSADSLALEVGHPLWRITALISETPKAPIARPESGFDDSDLEESAPSARVSANWKGFTLPSVQQSTDNVEIDLHPRPRANTNLSDSPSSQRSLKTLDYITSKTTSAGSIPGFVHTPVQASCSPPPKPPRTFETERSEGRQSFRYKPPPKPPRTFEYDSQIQANFSSSLYWNFPRPRARRFQTQISSPELDGSALSTDSVDRQDGQESEVALEPYSPHRQQKIQQYTSLPQSDKGEFNHTEDTSPLDETNDKTTLFSKQSSYHNGEAVRRPKPRSGDDCSGPESRYSVSDSGLNISQEEMFLLGSVKPRAGRRKRNALKQATSETLHRARLNFSSPDQSMNGPHRDANFLETTL